MKKKMLICFGALLSVLLFASCSNEISKSDVNSEAPPESSINSNRDITPESNSKADEVMSSSQSTLEESSADEKEQLAISIEVISDDYASKYSSFEEFVEFEDEGYQKIAVEINQNVTEFKFFEVVFNNDSLSAGSTLFELPELVANKPFIVTWMDVGAMPQRGISFTDEDGATKTYAISMSGDDGSLFLMEV